MLVMYGDFFKKKGGYHQFTSLCFAFYTFYVVVESQGLVFQHLFLHQTNWHKTIIFANTSAPSAHFIEMPLITTQFAGLFQKHLVNKWAILMSKKTSLTLARFIYMWHIILLMSLYFPCQAVISHHLYTMATYYYDYCCHCLNFRAGGPQNNNSTTLKLTPSNWKCHLVQNTRLGGCKQGGVNITIGKHIKCGCASPLYEPFSKTCKTNKRQA